jgi:hypothetical protein
MKYDDYEKKTDLMNDAPGWSTKKAMMDGIVYSDDDGSSYKSHRTGGSSSGGGGYPGDHARVCEQIQINVACYIAAVIIIALFIPGRTSLLLFGKISLALIGINMTPVIIYVTLGYTVIFAEKINETFKVSLPGATLVLCYLVALALIIIKIFKWIF